MTDVKTIIKRLFCLYKVSLDLDYFFIILVPALPPPGTPAGQPTAKPGAGKVFRLEEHRSNRAEK